MAVLETRIGRQPRIMPRQIGEHWPTCCYKSNWAQLQEKNDKCPPYVTLRRF